MKNIFIFIYFICFGMSSINAQVTDLKYLLKYNCENNLYDVKIKIMEGSATSVVERVQFNSQITILVPSGLGLEIVERYQPIVDNQQYGGTTPNQWFSYAPILSPDGHEKFDFYSIAPKLAPASFFNDINEGDEITLFSFEVGGEARYDERIRFFENSIDEKLSYFEGADPRNGYSLGGATDRYAGNIHENCLVSNNENLSDTKVKMYPNPTESEVRIDVSDNIKTIKLMDMAGRVLSTKINVPNTKTYTFDVSDLFAGIYYIQLDNGTQKETQKLMILQN